MDLHVTDASEVIVLVAALALYRADMARCRRLGGDALEEADLLDPIAARVQARVYEALYGTDEPVEPDWSLDTDDFAGDHHVYPAGVGR